MYGFVITTAGEAMLARAAAGETLVLDGASVGKGVVLSAADAKALTALIDPVAEATTSSPAVAGQQISITVEYRNDMNGGLETGFALSEFGITAHVGDDPTGLLYYGSLGDAPQTVKPIDQGLDAHRFPVAIAVTGEVTVTLDYPAGGFVTWDELGDLDYDPAGSAAAVKEELEKVIDTKAVKSYGVLSAANVLTWAKQQDGSGAFNVNPTVTTEGVPTAAWYSGFFEKSADGAYKLTLTRADNGQTFVNVTYAQEWIGWIELATTDSVIKAAATQMIPPPNSLDTVKALTPGNYSWVQSSALQWEPGDTPAGGIRVVLTVRKASDNQSPIFDLAYIDGGAMNRRYYGENGGTGIRWSKIATITSDPSTAGARAISARTTDLTAGSSALTTGQIYLVYG